MEIMTKKMTTSVIVFLIVLALSTTVSTGFISPPPSDRIRNKVVVTTTSTGGGRSSNSSRNNISSSSSSSSSRLYASTAPSKNKIAVIDSWKLLPDGRIKGVISPDGDNVLTSPLKNPKRVLKEKATIRTVSGSQYSLGTPADATTASTSTSTSTDKNKLRADQLGIPRATLGGGGRGARATQPLMSTPTTSQDRVLQSYLANKGRATMPLSSSSSSSPVSKKKKNVLLTPLLGGLSAVVVGAAIGTGVISDKGLSLDKVKSINVDPSEVLKSAKSLNLPDIKSLKAPIIPSVSLPQTSLFDTKNIKFPDINLPNSPKINFPNLKLPDVSLPSVPSVPPLPDGMKNLGDGVGNAIGNALGNAGLKLPFSSSETKKITSVGQGPYRVPMPYIDQKIIQAERERNAQFETEKKTTAEKEIATRMQIIRDEAEVRKNSELEIQGRRILQREEEAQKRTKRAEEEAVRLRDEVEEIRVAALAKEKAAAQETARLKKEAEEAISKEVVAKEEFMQKLRDAELAQLKEAQDFSSKLAEAEKSAANERFLKADSTEKQRLAEEAASRQAMATAEVRKASIGAMAARKTTYASPSLSTYEAWQEQQRAQYQTRMGEAAVGFKHTGGASTVRPASTLIVSDDNLSTFQKWQQTVSAKKIASMSSGTVTAASVTGAPAPVVNQLISGTTELSKASTALSGKENDISSLYYIAAAGTAVVIGRVGYEWQENDEQQSKVEETYLGTPPIQPPIQPPRPNVQVDQEYATSATMAIDAQPYLEGLASVTKEIQPRSYSPFGVGREPSNAMGTANDALYAPPPEDSNEGAYMVKVPTPTSSSATNEVNNGVSYLESMSSSSSDGLKASYSPFSSPKNVDSDSLYNAPASSSSLCVEYGETARRDESGTQSAGGASYLESMSGGSAEGLKVSYSPFSSPKKVGSDSLYDAPASPSSSLYIEYEEPVQYDDYAVADTQAADGASYLDSMSSGEGLKASYSPFSSPQKDGSDSLYDPPDSITSQPMADNYPAIDEYTMVDDYPAIDEYTMVDDYPPIDEYTVSSTAVNGASYLESMSGSGSAFVKDSYSPFGNPKELSTKDSLYGPPPTSTSETYIPEVASDFSNSQVNGASYLESMSGSGEGLKSSYSPFSDLKVINSASSQFKSDPLYDPPVVSEPSTTASSDSTTTNQGSYLNDLKDNSLLESPLKKSYSPFGITKPRAPTDDALYSAPTNTDSSTL